MPDRRPEIRLEQGPLSSDRILVAGGSPRTIELLRIAAVRSDHVVLVDPSPGSSVRRFADLFAVEFHERPLVATDLSGAGALLVAGTGVEAENALVRLARRAGVPVHVAGRELVSDFSLLDLVWQRPLSHLAA